MAKPLDVLFVHPSSSPIYQGLRSQYSAVEVPVWCLLLAQSCRSIGYGVEVLDCDAENLGVNSAAATIIASNARLIVFVVAGSEPNQSTVRMASAVAMAQVVKKECPEEKIAFVGNHPSALPKETLQGHACIDFVLPGDAVYALHHLLKTDLGTDLWKIKGVCWKPWAGNGCQEVILNEPENIVQQQHMSLALPGYAWDLLPKDENPLDKYRCHFWHGEYKQEGRSPSAALYTSLGCPMKCSFCCINLINRTNYANEITSADSSIFRYWDHNHTLWQIEKLVEYGVRNIRFSDEMFFLKPSHYEPLLNGIKFRWGDSLNLWAYARVDTVKPKQLELFRSAGVRWLALGIEAGNTVVRKEASKGSFKDVDIRDVVKEIEDHGIHVISNFIFGLPGDNHESMQQTLALACELNSPMANFYPAMALPGTPLYRQMKQDGKELPSNYEAFGFLSYECHPTGTQYLTSAEVVKFRDDAFHTYYGRPEFLKRIEGLFGSNASSNIKEMLKVKLKRKLLGDPPPNQVEPSHEESAQVAQTTAHPNEGS